jgi:Ca2+-transporting ATPase
VSLAVAAVPEGLPAVVTIALALGLQRMVKRNALIRRLASVETLGAVTVICSDKTGTLTRNEMTVTEVVAGGRSYRVTGSGYTPEGEFLLPNEEPVSPQADPDLAQALRIGLWCNNARLEPPEDEDPRWHVLGDPTEGALIVAAHKAGLRKPDGEAINELPFDSKRKLMSVVARTAEGALIFSKGAPEALLDRCDREQRDGKVVSLGAGRREKLLQQSGAMADRALRVLALAWRRVNEDSGTHVERDLIFAGLVGMIDPPRDEARVAVAKCRSAGIRPVVITGDHPATALAIARDLHIAGEGDRAITGTELDQLSKRDLAGKVERLSVYARVSPEHKLRVVRALQERGEVVAMTGDGVNDAPAVKTADIGIAMGITGTDVTREASDMVLTDDNFASIVNAVEEGRGIYNNIQEFVHYLLSCNICEIALVLFAALVGWPVPLIPIQILWINLVTDGLPALALAMEKPKPDVMERPPRLPNEPFLTRARGLRILGHGFLVAAAAIGGFAYAHFHGGAGYGRAMAFHITTFTQLFFAFGCRSHRFTLPELGLFSNPWLFAAIALSSLLQMSLLWIPLTKDIFFATTPHFGFDWLLIFALALAPVTVVELGKIIRSKFREKGGAQ